MQVHAGGATLCAPTRAVVRTRAGHADLRLGALVAAFPAMCVVILQIDTLVVTFCRSRSPTIETTYALDASKSRRARVVAFAAVPTVPLEVDAASVAL